MKDQGQGHGKSAQPTFCEALDWILSKRRVRTHRRHDPGSDGSVPLVLVGETVVGMQFPSHPHGDADDHGGYLCKGRDLINTSILFRKMLRLCGSIISTCDYILM